jgi:hypothetical protein
MENSKKGLEQGSEIVTAAVNLSEYAECSCFGKSKKTPAQNAGCFLASTVGYLRACPKNKASEFKRFKKYLQRIGQYASDECNEVVSRFTQVVRHDLSENKIITVAFYQLIRNLNQFEFECRKKIIQHFEEFSACRGWNEISIILNLFALEGDLHALVNQLIELCITDDYILGCAAKILKIFAQNPETFWVLLDWKIFEKIFRLAGDRNLQIAAEFAGILEVS